MAKLSSDGKYVTVEKGDTLTQIAVDYAGGYDKYKQLASINGISNPNLIYVGQKIYLTSSSGSSSSSASASSNKPIIKQFGLQSNTGRTLFATWNWSKHSQTDHYEVRWLYGTGDDVAFVGSTGDTKELHALYDIPEKASTRIIFKVRPISKTKKDANGKETTYFTAQWSDEKYYYISELPPAATGSLNVEIKDYKLTTKLTLTNLDDVTATHIQFQIVKDDASVYKTGTSKIVTGVASYSCTVAAGAEYKVRWRPVKNGKYGDWSDYSNNAGTGPSAPAGILTIKALSETSVQIDWANVSNATKYEVEYTTEKMYFDSNPAEVKSTTIDATAAGHAEITGLESGEEYFFRVRAVNDNGSSSWTAIKSIIIGEAPAAPTTWSSTTTAIADEDDITLFWVHNSKDNSSQTYAELEIYVNGTKLDIDPIKNSTDEDEENTTSFYSLSTAGLADAQIKWRVRTKGIIDEWSDWSIQRTIDVYTRPYFTEFKVADSSGAVLDKLSSFPIYISATAGPTTQTPIGYHVSIISNEIYETLDDIGNVKMVNKGEEVYSNFFDTSIPLDIILDAGNVDLHNNVSYTVYCTVSMDSGLTVEDYVKFTITWTDVEYQLNAEIAYDNETYVTYIRPYCENRNLTYYQVTYSGGKYTKTSTAYYSMYCDAQLAARYTTTGEQVYRGVTPDGDEIYYCEVEEETPITNVLLSVYRREFDGSFTELVKDIDCSLNTFITDPHPALDYARYRIVAKDVDTGAISFYDVPGYPTGEKAIIIQWDDAWSNFETNTEDPLEQPPWSGSLLRLPYNIKVSDKNAVDVSLVEYIGRKNAVSYYGTQIGQTSTWSTTIPKDDKETLYALRRLAIWAGDVYVREPSGSGYWANITVSFNQEYLATTIPVTLDITRVEGGM